MIEQNVTIDCIDPKDAQIGESPIWVPKENAVYWVDISRGQLHHFDLGTGQTKSWRFGEALGCVAPSNRDTLILALGAGFVEFDPVSERQTMLAPLELGMAEMRFNDGVVDPAGRFLAGTMRRDGRHVDLAHGALLSLEVDATVETRLDGFHIINGLAFSPDGKTGYVSDSYQSVRTIWAYDYDQDDGAWSNKRVFFDTSVVSGRPDGAAIDSAGCYWMAGIGGWELVRITPAGVVDMRVPFPVEKPSCIVFGGDKLDRIFVTSLSVDLTDGHAQTNAGGLFELAIPGISGYPEQNVILT